MSTMNAQMADFRQMLTENVLELTFTKADGSTRVMKATLMPTILPAVDPSVANRVKTDNTGKNIPVYDLDVGGWRSFIFENLISWRFIS